MIKDTSEEHIYRKLFYGEKEQVIKCVNIDYESSKKESFFVLQLHMQESNTIEAALRSLFTAEELSGENAYEHETLGKQYAKKFMRIRQLPPVLQININRFGVSEAGEMMKINSACEFGDYLDFDKILATTDSYILSQQGSASKQSQSSHQSAIGSNKRNFYQLHAILCHTGSLNRGHYFSYIRCGEADKNGTLFDDKTWVKFNDQVVIPAFKHQAFGTGQGGYNYSYRFCQKNDTE